MASHLDNLSAVLHQFEFAAGVVVASDGSILAQVGDLATKGYADLVSAVLGPYGDARATFESLEGQILPRMSTQGEWFAIIDKPGASFMVVFFGKGLSGVALYHLSKRVSTAIGERWMAACGSGPAPQV